MPLTLETEKEIKKEKNRNGVRRKGVRKGDSVIERGRTREGKE